MHLGDGAYLECGRGLRRCGACLRSRRDRLRMRRCLWYGRALANLPATSITTQMTFPHALSTAHHSPCAPSPPLRVGPLLAHGFIRKEPIGALERILGIEQRGSKADLLRILK